MKISKLEERNEKITCERIAELTDKRRVGEAMIAKLMELTGSKAYKPLLEDAVKFVVEWADREVEAVIKMDLLESDNIEVLKLLLERKFHEDLSAKMDKNPLKKLEKVMFKLYELGIKSSYEVNLKDDTFPFAIFKNVSKGQNDFAMPLSLALVQSTSAAILTKMVEDYYIAKSKSLNRFTFDICNADGSSALDNIVPISCEFEEDNFYEKRAAAEGRALT